MSYRDCLKALKAEIGETSYADLEDYRSQYEQGSPANQWARAAEDMLNQLETEQSEIVTAIQAAVPEFTLTPTDLGEIRASDIDKITADDFAAIMDSIPDEAAKLEAKPEPKPEPEKPKTTEDDVYSQITRLGKSEKTRLNKLNKKSAVELKNMARAIDGIKVSQTKAELAKAISDWYSKRLFDSLPKKLDTTINLVIEPFTGEDGTLKTLVEPIFHERMSDEYLSQFWTQELRQEMGEDTDRVRQYTKYDIDKLDAVSNYYGGTKYSKKKNDFGGYSEKGWHFPTEEAAKEFIAHWDAKAKPEDIIQPEQPPAPKAKGKKPVKRPVEYKGKAKEKGAEAIKKAAKLGVQGADEALMGLAELFGGKNKLSSGLSFDEESYQKAKPHFEAAFKKFAEAGRTLKDFLMDMIDMYGDGIRPYLKRWFDERQEAAQAEPEAAAEEAPTLREGEAVTLLKDDDEIPAGTKGRVTAIEEDVDGTPIYYVGWELTEDGETVIEENGYFSDNIGEYLTTSTTLPIEGTENVEPTTTDETGIGEPAGDAQRVDQDVTADETGRTERGAEQATPEAQETTVRGETDSGVSEVRAPVRGEQRNRIVSEESGEFRPETGAAGTGVGERGTDTGRERLPSKQDGSQTAEKAAAELKARQLKQRAVNGNKDVTFSNAEDIERTLPILLPEQRTDVVFAEKRFFDSDQRGVLFTNGTGTGKTYTGLGVIKRMTSSGYNDILIIAPNDGVVDGWIEGGREFGLNIHKLKDTKDSGQGVTITTYANLYQNEAIVRRNWDMIVPDEAQELMSSQSGKPTRALNMVRALTGHPRGVDTYADFMEADLLSEIDGIQGQLDAAKDMPEVKFQELNRKKMELLDEFNARKAAHRANRAEIWAGQKQEGTKKVYRMDLSATPFAHVPTVEHAEGFLFEYGPEPESRGYNTPSAREKFFIEHFGYRMRTGKLTAPEAGVDTAMMERQFNQWLRDQGALSGRQLQIDFDYSREFIAIEDQIGNMIDQGYDILGQKARDRNNPLNEGYMALEKAARTLFPYPERMKLLEAIKAPYAIERAKKHIELGRKVIIFHSLNKGGTVHPFRVLGTARDEIDIETGNVYELALAEFQREHAEFFNMEINERRPLDLMQEAFGDQMRQYNGTVTKKARKEAKELFNSDSSPVKVITIQEQAGGAGLSLHDVSGEYPRALINVGLPVRPVTSIQEEGRGYRVGNMSNAIFEYFTTGTTFERWTFAMKIAERAGTAENLSHGAEARALRDSFVDAFEAPRLDAPDLEQGLGGKAKDAAVWANLSDFDKAKTDYFATPKTSGRRDQRAGLDYFSTPEPLGLMMVKWGMIKPNENIIEPSAGHGAIARYFPENAKGLVIEPSNELMSRAMLRANKGKGVTRAEISNFEDIDPGANKADVVVMNPPFGKSAATAMAHLEKAMKHLRNGGRIVALIPEGSDQMEKKLSDLIFGKENEIEQLKEKIKAKRKQKLSFTEEQNRLKQLQTYHLVADVGLPPVTFERAGTKVKSHVVIIDRIDDANISPPYQGRIELEAGNIEEFFDKLKNIDVPNRVDVGESVEEILKRHKIEVKYEDNAFVVGGDTYNNLGIIRPVLRAHGGSFDNTVRKWVSQQDPSEALALALEGKPWQEQEVKEQEKPINWRQVWETPSDQQYRSTDASINKTKNPVTIGLVEKYYGGWKSGSVNADIGGGMHDNTIEYLKDQGVKNYVYDPFNRTPDYNAKSVAMIKDGQADTATINNTLNVIKEPDIRNKVLREAANAVKLGGTVYIQIYDGDGTGVGRNTKGDIWQENRKAEDYLEEVRRVFPDAEIKYGLITAKNTIVAHKAAEPVFDAAELEISGRSMDQIVADSGMKVTAGQTAKGNNVWEVSGNTFDHSEMLKAMGGKWFRPKKVWSFYDADPTKKLAEKLSGKKYLRQQQPKSGETVSSIKTKLRSLLGEKAYSTLVDGLEVMVVQNEDQLPSYLQHEEGGVVGVHDDRTGKTFLVADNINDAELRGVMLHEIGVHYGLPKMLGAKAFQDLLAQMKRAEAMGNKAIAAARAKVPSDTAPHLVEEEVLAYLVTDPKNHDMSIIKKLFARLKLFLRRLGLNVGKFSTAELVTIAEAGIRGDAMYLAQGIINQEMKDKEADKQVTSPAFKKWFKKSKVVDQSGNPLVVFHGTTEDFETFENKKRDMWGSDDRRGFYFTPNDWEAAAYTGFADNKAEGANVMPVYLSIQNPYNATRSEFGYYVTKQDIARLKKQGYDGVIKRYDKDDGGHVWQYIAFDANQIKSAIGNRGTFDPGDKRITYMRRGPAYMRRQNTRDPLAEVPLSDRNRVLKAGKNIKKHFARYFKRYMTKESLLPTGVFEEKIHSDAFKKVGEEEIKFILDGFEQVMMATAQVGTYKDVPDSLIKDANSYLAGNAGIDLPQRLKDQLDIMRDYLDNQSRYMLQAIQDLIDLHIENLPEAQQAAAIEFYMSGGQSGSVPAKLAGAIQLQKTIANNLGEYLHRSYQAFDDAKWKEKVLNNAELMERAKAYIREENPHLEETAANDEVEGAIREILTRAKDSTDFIDLVSRGVQVGQKDVSILKRKKKIPPIIREILGEYKDPKVNFASSASKMQWYLANHVFLTKMRQAGLEGGWLHKRSTVSNGIDYSTEVAQKGDPRLTPVDGLFTSEDIKQGMKDVMWMYDGSDFMRSIIKYNSMVKYGKTILSPTTQFRNFMSGMFFGILNGHLGLGAKTIKRMNRAFRMAYSDLFSQNAEHRGELNKLIGLGVLHDNPHAEELRLAVQEVMKDETELDMFTKEGGRWFRKGLWTMQKLYRFGDDFWKIIGFYAEVNSQMDNGLSRESAEKKAAWRIRNGYPTYSQVPLAMKKLRLAPLVGSFVSFPWEIMRTSYNQMGMMKQDIADGNTSAVVKRAMGMAIVSSASAAASFLSMAILGLDWDDDEAVRAQLPEWSRNSQLYYLWYNEDNQPVYLDVSFIDPYTYLKKPISAMINGNNHGIDEKIMDAFLEMSGPFVGVDIAAGAIFDVLRNKKQSGGPVYLPYDATTQQAEDIINHMRKAIQPGIASNTERMYHALMGTRSDSGKEYSVLGETAAFFGFRNATLNLPQSMIYKGYEFRDQKRAANYIIVKEAGSRKDISKADLFDSLDGGIKAWNSAYTRMIEMVAGSRRLGVDDQRIIRSLQSANVSKRDIGVMMRGQIPRWRMSSSFLRSAESRAFAASANKLEAARARSQLQQRRLWIREYLQTRYR